ncbi:LamG-like jellyroll fold domain-containing protein [Nakamurella sp. A5-74]|uniref:LamG-like jellyroll fold domain-containing protein n=1 Tax=Nakamurella sp. A5-74 TaxID=3158264 RepID=A0AAU8DT17_9ACTN
MIAVACTVGLMATPAIAGPASVAPGGPTATRTASGPTASASTWSGLTAPLPTRWTSQVSPTNALPDYPRPQLARPSVAAPKWLSLNGLWQYAPTDGFTPPVFGADLDGQILVPYPAESVLSGVQKHSDYMFYRRTVTVPKNFLSGGQHLRLNFGAVNYDAAVYVNGIQVARHLGGYDSFSVDVTAALRVKGPQEILVAVHSPVDSATIPVGKQRLDPDGIFYTAASGIWQSVWLEPVAATSIASFTATPDAASSSFTFKATLNGDPTNARLAVDVYAGTKKVAAVSGAAGGTMRVTVPKPRLWSPADPFLYTFKVRLTGHGTDVIESYAGLRSVAVQLVNGKQRITLNGKATFLLSTLDQGYWPDGIYTAPTDAALKFDIQKTKDLGFNTIRKHIKVEPARWYYWADKLGIMVWQDSPALPTGRNGSLTAGDKANFRAETAQMVGQLANVTSIIGWIPFNEGWGQWSVAAASEVGAQIKAQDPSRLVNDRSGFNCCDTPGDPGTGDIIDWHQYQGPALPAPDATRASIDGEHGGLTLTVPGHTWPGAPINPYGSVPDAAALNAGYEANNAVLRDQGAPYGLSGSVYTQITDVEGEQNGFFTYDREVEKVDEARVRASNLAVINAGSKPTPPAPPGTPGLGGVDRWSFDETTGTTAADGVGGHDLTLRNGAKFGPGLAGNALVLNGVDQSAESSGTLIPTTNTNYTVSAWAKASSFGGAFQTVMSEDGAATSAFFLQYSGADKRWAFSFASIRALATTVGMPVAGQWYHLVGVRDVTRSRLSIYVDGVLAGSVGILGGGDLGTGNLQVGRGQFGGNPVDYLNGSVDDARVFDRELTAAEVAALHEAGPGATQ